MKGSGTTPLDSSKVRVEVLLKLSWLNTSVGTNNTQHIYNMNNVKQCKIRKRVERKDPKTNKRICFEVRVTALHPRLHTEGFSLFSHRTFHKGTSTEELQLNTGSAQLLPSNTNTSAQEERQNPGTK